MGYGFVKGYHAMTKKKFLNISVMIAAVVTLVCSIAAQSE